jgi:ligand-binding SRPBCC domain-containing protein
LINIPQTEVTESTHVNEPNYFVDDQRFCPYKMWHQQYIFTKTYDGGVMIEDIVSCVVPFGFLGRIMNTLVISKKTNEIFNYRSGVLEKMFG